MSRIKFYNTEESNKLKKKNVFANLGGENGYCKYVQIMNFY